MSEPLLQLNGVTVEYGAFTALDEVDLRVDAGQIVGVIGPNGAGKTTLVNAIFGVSEPTRGEVLLRGEDLRGRSPDRRAHLGLARTFQNLELFATMTVLENVLAHADAAERRSLFSWGSRHRAADRRERAMDVLAALSLDDVADRAVRELSYPQRKIVEFARCMVVDVDLVLLDEPTAGVPLEDRHALIERMHQHMRQRHVAGLVVEHDMNVISTLCEYVYVLDGGRLIAAGTFQEVIDDPRVREAYLGLDAAQDAV